MAYLPAKIPSQIQPHQIGPIWAVFTLILTMVYNLLFLLLYIIVLIDSNMDLKGKQIKNYILGTVTTTQHNMHLLAGHTINNQPVSILMIDKAQLEQKSFVGYVNLLQ